MSMQPSDGVLSRLLPREDINCTCGPLIKSESRKWCGHSCWPMYHDVNNNNNNKSHDTHTSTHIGRCTCENTQVISVTWVPTHLLAGQVARAAAAAARQAPVTPWQGPATCA
jgi:hypothetical protein